MDAINLLASIPTSFGAPAAALQAGQVVQALVLELLESGAFRLQLPQALLDVRSDVPLTPGSTVTLAVKGAGANMRLDILAQNSAGAAASAPPDVAATGQAVRRPIGEAIIVGRMALPDVKAPATPTVRDAPPDPVTPSAALVQAVRSAAPRQDGLAPLSADLAQVVQSAALPAPVEEAAAKLLALQVPLDETLSASDLKQAFARSGVLMEARLAVAAQPGPSAPSDAPEGPDLKAALLVLRQALKTWANAAAPIPDAKAEASRPGSGEAVSGRAGPLLSAQDAEGLAKRLGALLAKAPASVPAASSPNAGPAPPYRGAPLVPQPPVPPVISETAQPREIAERLVTQADAALARGTLLQAASLPDAVGAEGPRETGPRWNFEVPFAMPQGTGVVPFEVARDGRAAPAEPHAGTWRARFCLDLEAIGPVHALVALTGDRVSVTLCAERISTATQLNDSAPLPGDALRAAELEPSELSVRVGTPRAAKPAAPGRFMDRAS